MSLGELIYRIFQQIQKRKEKLIDHRRGNKAFVYECANKVLDVVPNHLNYPGKTEIFGLPLDVDERIDWHLDPYTGKVFPKIFSKDILIQSDKFGSAKHVWEVNRLLFLPQICFNYVNTKDEQYLDLFMHIIKSWVKEDPYLTGINWYSNIEVNIRLINWFLCWEILHADELAKGKNEFKEFIYKDWLPVIYMHCDYSHKNPSRFSSANNHLISEYAGLFVASSLWQFRESDKWNTYAKKGLEEEIRRQHSPNGINKEEAAEYIQFITDFLLLSYVVGEKTNNRFSEEYRQMLKSIFRYIMEFTDIRGNFPRYGDEDDGRVFILDPDHRVNNFSSLMTSAAIIFNDTEFKNRSSGFDPKNQVLFGKEGEVLFYGLHSESTPYRSIFYPKEGHFISRKQTNKGELYIHFDAASLGYLSIAAHGHADALSFVLHLNGKEVFADTGTFAYHTDPLWRQYFIGTLGHNTIRINRKNQATNAGPTLWLDHFKVKVIEATTGDNYDKIVASHNGYEKDGIIHTREFLHNKTDQIITIKDYLDNKSNTLAFVEFPLHLHPDMTPVSTGKGFDVYDKEKLLIAQVICDAGFTSVILKGNQEPILGWYSGSFYRKEPCSIIYQYASIATSITFTTIIKIIGQVDSAKDSNIY